MVTCGKSKLFLFLVAEFDYNMVTSGKDGIYIGTLRDCLLGNAVDVRWKYTKKTFEEGLKKAGAASLGLLIMKAVIHILLWSKK